MASSLIEESDLRSAIQFAVIQICAEEDADQVTRMSPKALSALAELTFMYTQSALAPDLTAYCRHAGRKTITEADVKLVARKSENILSRLEAFSGDQKGQSSTGISENEAPKVNQQQIIDVDLSDDTDDDAGRYCLEPEAKKVAGKNTGKTSKGKTPKTRKCSLLPSDSSSSSDSDMVTEERDLVAAEALRRKTLRNMGISCSDEDSGDKMGTTNKKRKTPRALEILATMSQDSVPSSDENEF